MKVTGPGSAGPLPGAPGAKRAGGDGFAPAGADGARELAAPASAGGAAMVGSLDALIALQGTADPTERRRRAMRRAGRLLDVLDEVKLAVLDGVSSVPALERLGAAVREQRDGVDDPRLQALLDQIETRAAVELARREVARTAA